MNELDYCWWKPGNWNYCYCENNERGKNACLILNRIPDIRSVCFQNPQLLVLIWDPYIRLGLFCMFLKHRVSLAGKGYSPALGGVDPLEFTLCAVEHWGFPNTSTGNSLLSMQRPASCRWICQACKCSGLWSGGEVSPVLGDGLCPLSQREKGATNP